MTLQEYTESLSEFKQLKLAIALTKQTLSIWEQYANLHKLTYVDNITATTHNISQQLLSETIIEVEHYYILNKPHMLLDEQEKLLKLSKQFTEPIVAIQNLEWKLPDEVLKTFYAVYNLLETVIGEKKTTFGDSTIYVSINQAIDALDSSKTLTEQQIKKFLKDAKNDL